MASKQQISLADKQMIMDGKTTMGTTSPGRLTQMQSSNGIVTRKDKLESDLRSRLATGWRRIYRAITKADTSNSGIV